ncbi:MAG: hypothetical protein FWF77_01700 [Defluviitaleaceae bacterium]|nr:hypothetical protein [Defluviitaleaceae bacterium]
MIDILSVLTGATPETVVGSLDAARFPDAYKGLFETIRRDIPFKEGEAPPEEGAKGSCDWDRLYYIGRERLVNFYPTDDEFWNSTPRRFWKLYELWLWDNNLDKETEQIEDMEVYMGELDI